MKIAATLLAGAAVLAATAASVQATGFANYFALLATNGTVIKGIGVVSGTKAAAGTYHVEFARSVANCALIATIRGATPGMIVTGQKGGVNDTVVVTTFSQTGVKTDMPFYLLVQCNS